MNKHILLSFQEGDQINARRSNSAPQNATIERIEQVLNDADEVIGIRIRLNYEDGRADSHSFDFVSSHPWAVELGHGWVSDDGFEESDADPSDLGLK